MTLIEKFQTITSWWKEAGKCEKIADEFAIGFAEWMLGDDSWRVSEETLENYKKEKGL
jgi:hypothetical protein